MNRVASLFLAALVSLTAVPAFADVIPDPCMMSGAKVGDPCMSFSVQEGTCQTDPTNPPALICTAPSSTSSGSSSGTSSSTGAGAGGSSSSSGGGGGGCSVGGFDPAGLATLSAGIAVLAGAALRRRRARKG